MANNESGELSERELEILRLVATGASNKEIAQTLFISSNTVKVHLRNIFNKIGVTSRTEAAMYAVRIGLVKTSSPQAEVEERIPTTGQPVYTGETTQSPPSKPQIWLQKWGVVLVLVMVLAALAIGILLAQLPIFRDRLANTAVVEAIPSATAIQRWQEHTALPTARSGLASAAFENFIYVIGGETLDGVTGAVERYSPATDEWTALSTKPLAVTDIHAAVIGGKIYVPGGRLGNGEISSVLEAYDPAKDTWEERASLPFPLASYALIAYEGRMYIFGGWDGDNHVNSVYAYDPSMDTWQARTSMPTARSFCGAATSSNLIFILGGTNETGALASSDVYNPARDNGSDYPWEAGPALPEARYAMGVTSASDLIYLIGGKGLEDQELSLVEYSPTTSGWQKLSSSIPPSWTSMGTASLGQYLYVMGGSVANKPTDLNMAYQAIYTVVLPFVR